ncbi:YczI family protein [Bacillus wiedmannii]|uniref:YczI family protein n=1 Tax=Bacillus wiedmannii TaxID=1890302 RepID=A0AA95LVR5_9BACI|nr:YczI family protein [Bacillus wiedmannii]WHY28658.1 YczI family protein [Bacillus wiedmannii]
MLKGVRITFALIALSIAIYGFISGNRDIIPYMFIFLGAMAFTIGLEEIKKQKQSSSILAFMAGAGALLLGFSEIFR